VIVVLYRLMAKIRVMTIVNNVRYIHASNPPVPSVCYTNKWY